jgi:hypothetical protein
VGAEASSAEFPTKPATAQAEPRLASLPRRIIRFASWASKGSTRSPRGWFRWRQLRCTRNLWCRHPLFRFSATLWFLAVYGRCRYALDMRTVTPKRRALKKVGAKLFIPRVAVPVCASTRALSGTSQRVPLKSLVPYDADARLVLELRNKLGGYGSFIV